MPGWSTRSSTTIDRALLQLEPDTSAAMEPSVGTEPVVARDDPVSSHCQADVLIDSGMQQEAEYEVEGGFGLCVDPELADEIPEEIAAEDDDVTGLTKRESGLTNHGEADEK